VSRRPVAFITGASRGIGRGIALELARSGFDMVGNATTYDPADRTKGLAEVQATVEALGAAFEPAPGDVSRLELHEGLLAAALDRFGAVDVLINNAGVAPGQRLDVLETTPESYDRVLGVNLRGAFFLTQCFARRMVELADAGRLLQPGVVFVSSISADTSSPSRAEYCISKAGTSQAARVFADRLAGHGINVYEVRPGIIETNMTAPVRDQYDARIADGLVPLKRWGTPRDVGRAVAALARGDFGYATGLVVELSGGMNIRRL